MGCGASKCILSESMAEIFQLIYDAALNEDRIQINELVKMHGSIDIQHSKSMPLSAAAKLSFEGKDFAVEFLRLNGADVNLLIKGYILARNHSKVEEYSRLYGASFKVIAESYRANNDKEYAERYEIYSKDRASFSFDSIINKQLKIKKLVLMN